MHIRFVVYVKIVVFQLKKWNIYKLLPSPIGLDISVIPKPKYCHYRSWLSRCNPHWYVPRGSEWQHFSPDPPRADWSWRVKTKNKIYASTWRTNRRKRDGWSNNANKIYIQPRSRSGGPRVSEIEYVISFDSRIGRQGLTVLTCEGIAHDRFYSHLVLVWLFSNFVFTSIWKINSFFHLLGFPLMLIHC